MTLTTKERKVLIKALFGEAVVGKVLSPDDVHTAHLSPHPPNLFLNLPRDLIRAPHHPNLLKPCLQTFPHIPRRIRLAGLDLDGDGFSTLGGDEVDGLASADGVFFLDVVALVSELRGDLRSQAVGLCRKVGAEPFQGMVDGYVRLYRRV